MASPKRKPSGGIGTPLTSKPSNNRTYAGVLKTKQHTAPGPRIISGYGPAKPPARLTKPTIARPGVHKGAR